jgi:hypothetical protein
LIDVKFAQAPQHSSLSKQSECRQLCEAPQAAQNTPNQSLAANSFIRIARNLYAVREKRIAGMETFFSTYHQIQPERYVTPTPLSSDLTRNSPYA